MNEHDDKLAQLFFAEEPDTDSEAFTAAVRRRVARHRVLAKAVEVGVIAALAITAATLVAFVPDIALYPVQRVNEILLSPLGALAALLGTVGVVYWTRYGDA